MKTIYIFVLSLVTAATCAQKSTTALSSNVDKIDSTFNIHFKILDTYISDPSSDSSGRRMTSIHLLEATTGIKSSGPFTYIGRTSFNRENLEAWHKWYNKNRNKLAWDSKTKSVWRKNN
jgi:hypothetical protein